MHEFLKDWLIQDMFNMKPGLNHITDEFLDGLPESLVRAALKHMLTYDFPRSLNKTMPLEVKAKGKYLLPEDNQVQERKQELPVDDTIPCPRPPAGGWRHGSAPPASRNVAHRVYGDGTDGLDGEAGEEIFMRPRKKRRFQSGSSL